MDQPKVGYKVRQEYFVTIPPVGSPDREFLENTIIDEADGIEGEISDAYIVSFLIEKFHVGDFTQYVEGRAFTMTKVSNDARISDV